VAISAEFSSVAQRVPVREFLIIWWEVFEVLEWSFRPQGTGHRIAT
jgi:hypothetical protein